MSKCPTCGKVLNTEQGMKSHHKRVHGESIAGFNVDCEQCGKSINKQSLEHGNYHFCSTNCQSKWQKEYQVGENNPYYNSIECSCHTCGSTFSKPKNQYEGSEKHFCSTNCVHIWQRKQFSGEGNPNYKGGEVGFGDNWTSARRNVRDKYGNKCQNCGLTEDKIGRKPPVHHIIPRRKFDNVEDSNDLSNLTQLCVSCHMEFENMSKEKQCERLNIPLPEIEL